MKTMKKVLFFLLLTVLMVPAFAQKAYKLEFKPKQGEKYDAVTTMKSSIKQSIMGKDMVIDMNYKVDMLYDVTGAGQNTSLDMTYNKLEMDMKMMGQDVKMSSEADDDANPANKTFKALKGSKISLVVTPDGKVADVKGAEALAEKFADLSAAEKEMIKNFISKENLKSMMEQSFQIYPSNPVKAGDTWTGSIKIESPYKMTSDNTYKLLKVENGIAFVDAKGIVSTNGAQTMTMNGMELMVELSGNQAGTLQIDEATGVIKSSDMKQILKGKMTVMGQEIPMEMTSDVGLIMIRK